jgi:hypothetical protein
LPQGAQEAAVEIRTLGREAFIHQVDTGDEAAVDQMVEAAVKAMGNAGGGSPFSAACHGGLR